MFKAILLATLVAVAVCDDAKPYDLQSGGVALYSNPQFSAAGPLHIIKKKMNFPFKFVLGFSGIKTSNKIAPRLSLDKNETHAVVKGDGGAITVSAGVNLGIVGPNANVHFETVFNVNLSNINYRLPGKLGGEQGIEVDYLKCRSSFPDFKFFITPGFLRNVAKKLVTNNEAALKTITCCVNETPNPAASANGFIDWIKNVGESIEKGVVDAAEAVGSWTSKEVKEFEGWAKETAEDVEKWASHASEDVEKAFKKAAEECRKDMKKAGKKIKELLKKAEDFMVNVVLEGIEQAMYKYIYEPMAAAGCGSLEMEFGLPVTDEQIAEHFKLKPQ